jgi:hypothetical protein
MILLRYLLVFGGIMLLAGAVAILIMDVYQILKFRKDSSVDAPSLLLKASELKGMQSVSTTPR